MNSPCQPESEAILSTLPYGYLLLDSANSILVWNPWLEKHTGISKENALGKALTEVIQIQPSKLNFLKLAREQNRPYILSAKLHGAFLQIPLKETNISGFSFMQQETHILPLQGGCGSIGICIRDVTATSVGEKRVKSLKKALDQAIESAENANRAKSDFLAMISHDIRTPMNGVLGFTELMLASSLDNEQEEYLLSIKSSAKMLITLLNDILDFSKMEAGKMQILVRPFKPADIIRESIQLLRLDAQDKAVELLTRIAPDVPEVVLGDPVRFQQVVINLVSNSVKFTEKGSVTVSMCCKPVDASSCSVNVSVKDTGIGMHADAIQNLFNPYVRLDDVVTRRKAGTGLGLVISRRLCQAMGGDISVSSEYGKGSEFKFNILAQYTEDQRIMEPAAEQDAALHIAPDLRIALVDDSPTNRKLSRLLLRKLGLEITALESASALFELLRKETFDLVFMDVQMPDIDGLEATQKIRSGEAGALNANVRICALTALAMTDDRDHCMQAGMNDYLAKPLNIGELRKLLATVSPSAR